MPNPRAGETRDDWIDRCMGDAEAVADFPDNSQRYAVCISKWEGKADGYKPTDAMKKEAQRGLDWRAEHGRGGTDVGVARARDIVNGKSLSRDTIGRMASFFARHEVDKDAEGFSPGEDGYPSAGRIAWALWGGDPGKTWADNIMASEKAASGMIEHKDLSLQVKSLDEDGTFEGYASVFGVIDEGLDSVEGGAFAKSLGKRRPKMLWQHEMDEVIGVWDEVREDDTGLYVKGRLAMDVQKGREAYSLMKMGAIDSMSIGYRTVEAEMDGRIRKLMEVELYEVSLVTFPMLPAAKVTGVKSIGTEREYERFLRDAGFSRKEATALALHGFKGLKGQRDAGEGESEALARFTEQLGKLMEHLNDRGNQAGG